MRQLPVLHLLPHCSATYIGACECPTEVTLADGTTKTLPSAQDIPADAYPAGRPVPAVSVDEVSELLGIRQVAEVLGPGPAVAAPALTPAHLRKTAGLPQVMWQPRVAYFRWSEAVCLTDRQQG
ncbi:hypothetical protein GCM10010507_11960 [Streptomyces cinnamoneus]|uniref:Uncharacterized protein n=1 Tax=Streptomyces cinnamoneus TaxID=53446 RepID=A0A918WEP1_STRCJ|nr:hypothetical protein GCM10010507_11960 [Streptomyces cinnamoneus]